MTELAFLHLAVGDEHLSQVFEQTGPAEGAVGDGGARHLRDGADTEQLVLGVAGEGAHKLTWWTQRFLSVWTGLKLDLAPEETSSVPHPVGSGRRLRGSRR